MPVAGLILCRLNFISDFDSPPVRLDHLMHCNSVILCDLWLYQMLHPSTLPGDDHHLHLKEAMLVADNKGRQENTGCHRHISHPPVLPPPTLCKKCTFQGLCI